MKNKFFFAVVFLATFSESCKKPPLEIPAQTPTTPHKTRLNILWQKSLHPDTVEVFGSVPHVIDGDFVYQRSGPPAPTPLVRRNGDTGNIVWEWINHYKNVEIAFDGFLASVGQDYMIADHFWYYGIDGNNGNTLWRRDLHDMVCSSGGGTVPISKWAYSVHTTCERPFSHDAFLVRYDVPTGQYDTVCHLNGGDSLFINITGILPWTDPNGDPVLILLNLALQNNQPRTGQFWCHAWNLKKKEMVWTWRVPNASSTGGITICNNRLYCRTAQRLVCIETGTWKVLWERDYKVPNSAYIAQVIEYKNQLIVKCDNGQLDLLDPTSGALLWQTKEAGYTPIGGMKLFEGVAYYTSAGDGRIYAVDIDNRKVLWAEDSPNAFVPRTGRASFFMSGVAIDTINRRLFTCDRFYAMSMKLAR